MGSTVFNFLRHANRELVFPGFGADGWHRYQSESTIHLMGISKAPGSGCGVEEILIDRQPVASPVGNKTLAGNGQVCCRFADGARQVANSIDAFIQRKDTCITQGVGVSTV